MGDFTIVVIIMLSTGLVGGTVNYLLANPSGPKPFDPSGFFLNLLYSISAAFIVPLFLKLISSEIIPSNVAFDKTTISSINVLYLIGLSMVASISARTFINSVTNKILKELDKNKEETKSIKEETDRISSTLAEKSLNPEANLDKEKADTAKLDEKSISIMKSIHMSPYIVSNLDGLVSAHKKNLVEEDVKEALNDLVKKGLVLKKTSHSGDSFALTNSGLSLFKK